MLLPVERLLAGDTTLQPAPDRRRGGARARPPAPRTARRSGSRCPTPTRRCSATPTSRARRTRPRSPPRASRPRTRSRSRACSAAAWSATPRRCARCSRRRSSSPATPSSRSPAGSRARPRSCCRCRAACSTTCSCLHLQQLLRNDVLGIAERTSGKVSDRTDTAVAFADLVGFTELGETVDVEELGGLAGRLSKMASEVVEQPRARGQADRRRGDVRLPRRRGRRQHLPRADRARRGARRTSRRCAPASPSARPSTAGATASARPSTSRAA